MCETHSNEKLLLHKSAPSFCSPSSHTKQKWTQLAVLLQKLAVTNSELGSEYFIAAASIGITAINTNPPGSTISCPECSQETKLVSATREASFHHPWKQKVNTQLRVWRGDCRMTLLSVLPSDGDTEPFWEDSPKRKGVKITKACLAEKFTFSWANNRSEPILGRPNPLHKVWKHSVNLQCATLLSPLSFQLNHEWPGWDESWALAASLGWPGSRPAARHGRQDIPPFPPRHGQRCQPRRSARKGTGRELLLLSVFCLFALLWQQAKGSPLAKFITIIKCSKLQRAERCTVRRRRKKKAKFAIKLQDFVSLRASFRKQVRQLNSAHCS